MIKSREGLYEIPQIIKLNQYDVKGITSIVDFILETFIVEDFEDIGVVTNIIINKIITEYIPTNRVSIVDDEFRLFKIITKEQIEELSVDVKEVNNLIIAHNRITKLYNEGISIYSEVKHIPLKDLYVTLKYDLEYVYVGDDEGFFIGIELLEDMKKFIFAGGLKI